MKQFEKKVVVVTGASRGIGQAVCAGFGQEHATVVGVARGDLTSTAARVREAGGEFVAVLADLGLGTQAGAQGVVETALKECGRIDVLVNNAGIIRRAPAADVSEVDWNDVIRTNLNAPFFLSQAAARWWLASGRSASAGDSRLKIVNVASLLSFQGGINVPAYTASKHGLAGVTRALANEWARERINVNAVAPGYIATENTRALREDPVRSRAIGDRIPEGRWGVPEDIAGAIVFLASSAADYLNGVVLNVDGGWLAR
jgi:2-deoxy-D-gluconate 3-dehydrogenase